MQRRTPVRLFCAHVFAGPQQGGYWVRGDLARGSPTATSPWAFVAARVTEWLDSNRSPACMSTPEGGLVGSRACFSPPVSASHCARKTSVCRELSYSWRAQLALPQTAPFSPRLVTVAARE